MKKIMIGVGIFLLIVGVFFGLWAIFDSRVRTSHNPPRKDYKAEDLVGLSFSCNHMSRTECYSFSIGLKDEGLLFSADYMTEDGEEIKFEDRPIDVNHLEDLIEIASYHDFQNMVEREPSPVFVSDATSYSLYLYWNDGEYERIGHPRSGIGDLKDFFFALVEEDERSE